MVLPLGLVPDRNKAVNLDKPVIMWQKSSDLQKISVIFVFSDRHSESLCIWFVVIPYLQILSLFS